jgi:hypothetical protein
MITGDSFHLSPLLRRGGSDWLRSRRTQGHARKCVIMEQEKRRVLDRALWAYGYELAPPVARDRMGGIQSVLDEGHSEAELASQTWEGRFVNGDRIQGAPTPRPVRRTTSLASRPPPEVPNPHSPAPGLLPLSGETPPEPGGDPGSETSSRASG